jgi:heptosyltransferase II
MSRVLIVKLGAIGDVIMVIPAVHALHQGGAQIDWICGPAVAPLLACYPWIRTIVANDHALIKGSIVNRLRALTKLWWQVGRSKYDLNATLYYDTRYKLLTLPVRARRKLMLSQKERDSRLIPTRHHSDEYVRILLGQQDTCRAQSSAPIPPERLPASPLPEPSTSIRVGIVPGGASNMLRQQSLRRWPVANYVELTRQLLDRGYEVVLLGGPDDTWVRPDFIGLPVIDTIGTLSLTEVISVCNTCDVVVSHDTGPMHLAGLSRAALLGLFGPTDPGSFLPRRNEVCAIWGGEGFACRPCYDGRDFSPCQNNGCMQQITIPMALRQLDALLANRAAGVIRSQLVVLPSSMPLR